MLPGLLNCNSNKPDLPGLTLMGKIFQTFLICYFVFLGLQACNSDQSGTAVKLTEKGRSVPEFNSDSAYAFVEQQVALGPRSPGSDGHRAAKRYLSKKLKEYAGNNAVFRQDFTQIGYQSDTLSLSNFIAAFNTRSRNRIMLCAHWDTRPRADEAENPADQVKPILGADDGASGVAVLLELARTFKENPPPIGVDIVLFDGEDYGKKDSLQHYFLGSRYWAENPPVKGYNPRFSVLLDMVGGKDAIFPKEGYSMEYAGVLVNAIWDVAAEMGYEDQFPDVVGKPIQDDHVIINEILNIPALDIIHHKPKGEQLFASYWHTPHDNMHNISTETLGKVGQLLTEVIYNRL